MHPVKNIASLFLDLTPRKLKDFLLNVSYLNVSYSQEGEDLILSRIFGRKKDGFFVDVGAHHPKKYSNTYRFYREGWRGINIDAMPGSMRLFRKLRPNDINIEAGIAREKGELIYSIFNETALNTFNEEEANRKNALNGYRIIEQKKVQVFPLVDILDQHLKPSDTIDFLSIDVEGLDFDVLQSNNWEKYRPNIVLIEELRKPSGERETKGSEFLFEKGYRLFAQTYNTLIFKEQNFPLQ